MRHLQKTIINVLLLALVFLSAEVVARSFAKIPDVIRYAPSNITPPEVFAGNDFSPKQPGELKIVCFGDSNVYGWPLTKDDSWPTYLQQELRRRGARVRVYNFGWPGSTSYQTLWAYRNYLRQYPPDEDIVLVHTLANDSAPALVSDEERRQLCRRAAAARSVLDRSTFYRWLRYQLNTKDEEAEDVSRTISRVPPGEYGSNLEEMNKLAIRDGARLYFVELPTTVPRCKSFKQNIPSAIQRINLSGQGGLSGSLIGDGVHFDPEGHSIIARLVADVITKEVSP